MNDDKLISFPNELLETMTIEETIFTPENKNIGVAILSEMENTNHVLRIFQLVLSPDKKQYNFVQELAAFSFKHRSEVDEFLKILPNMSGLEMLMLLHPNPGSLPTE